MRCDQEQSGAFSVTPKPPEATAMRSEQSEAIRGTLQPHPITCGTTSTSVPHLKPEKRPLARLARDRREVERQACVGESCARVGFAHVLESSRSSAFARAIDATLQVEAFLPRAVVTEATLAELGRHHAEHRRTRRNRSGLTNVRRAEGGGAGDEAEGEHLLQN